MASSQLVIHTSPAENRTAPYVAGDVSWSRRQPSDPYQAHVHVQIPMQTQSAVLPSPSPSPAPSLYPASQYYYGGVSYPSQQRQSQATWPFASCLCLPIPTPTAGASTTSGDAETYRWRGIKNTAGPPGAELAGAANLESDRLSEVLNTDIRELMTRLKSNTEPLPANEEAKEHSTQLQQHCDRNATGEHTHTVILHIRSSSFILIRTCKHATKCTLSDVIRVSSTDVPDAHVPDMFASAFSGHQWPCAESSQDGPRGSIGTATAKQSYGTTDLGTIEVAGVEERRARPLNLSAEAGTVSESTPSPTPASKTATESCPQNVIVSVPLTLTSQSQSQAQAHWRRLPPLSPTLRAEPTFVPPASDPTAQVRYYGHQRVVVKRDHV
jgi:hypothetical protein